jgi:2-polyprenyl-3-methyl-5-hydroxy-6-metoxy-1,4-benzoquinol methylase
VATLPEPTSPASVPAPVVAGDTHLQSEVLEGLSEAVNYRRWLASLATPWLGDDPLEIGSGTGDYAEEWAAQGVSLTASEADPMRLELLRTRFDGHPQISVRELAVPLVEEAEHSAVVAYNVLEHIADDVEALRAFANLVRPGGRVILIVPAFPIAMSRFDREIGHFRRYRVETLAQSLSGAQLQVEALHYVNTLGLLAWIVLMRLLGQRPGAGAALRVYDGLVVPTLRRLETGRKPLFGQSVFAVARRG